MPAPTETSDVPFVSAFEDLINLSAVCGKQLCAIGKLSPLQDTFSRLLLLISDLVQKLEAKPLVPFNLSWKPTQWLSTILDTFDQEVAFRAIV